jgi:hypothetical protein
MKFLEIIKLVISMLPLLIEAIKVIEEALPGKSNGEVKLETVRNILETSYKSSNDMQVKFESAWPTFKSIIDAIVSSFNKIGVFSK